MCSHASLLGPRGLRVHYYDLINSIFYIICMCSISICLLTSGSGKCIARH